VEVTEFIVLEMTKPFRPGDTDCANTADRWFTERRGFSAMAAYGRKVSDADDMSVWLSEPGSIVRGMRQVMEMNGCERTITPVTGDVGIIIVGMRACIAIYTPDGWWSRDEDGFITADDSYRNIAWSVA
jgi:hypothetical protein